MGTIFPNSRVSEKRLRDGQSPMVTQPEGAEHYLDRGLPAPRAQTLGCLSLEGMFCGLGRAGLHLLTLGRS